MASFEILFPTNTLFIGVMYNNNNQDVVLKQNKKITMKHLILILLAFVSVVEISAQARYGATVGTGIITARTESVYVGNVSDYATHEVTFKGASPVINAGLTYQNKIGWMFMQPSIQYSQYSLDYDVESFPEAIRGVRSATEKYQYIDLHATAGIHAQNFRLGFGPVFHILAGFKSGLDEVPSYQENQSVWSAGFSGSFGYDLYPVSFDLKYEGSFKSFGDHIYLNNAKSRLKGGPDQLSLSITYTLPQE